MAAVSSQLSRTINDVTGVREMGGDWQNTGMPGPGGTGEVPTRGFWGTLGDWGEAANLELAYTHPRSGERVEIQQAVRIARAEPFELRDGIRAELVCWGVMPSGLLSHPLFLRFRGGKGGATGAGTMAVLAPPAVLLSILVFVLVILWKRYVSLATVTASATLPGYRSSR